jgi:hypothetical protein
MPTTSRIYQLDDPLHIQRRRHYALHSYASSPCNARCSRSVLSITVSTLVSYVTYLSLIICKGTSIHFLTSSLLSHSPSVHMYYPHTSVPFPGITPQSRQPSYSKSDDVPDVNSPEVVDIPLLAPLVPQRHRTCLRRIRIGPRGTMAPSAVTWKASYGRFGTGRLGTVDTSIYFVVGPSQGSLEHSLWISPD